MKNVLHRSEADGERSSANENIANSMRVDDRLETNSDLQERYHSSSSEDEEDDVSEASSFQLAADEDMDLEHLEGERTSLSNSFLLAAAHAQSSDYAMAHLASQQDSRMDPETEAKLVAFFAAVSSAASSPRPLEELTSTVSSALDEATVALRHIELSEGKSLKNVPLPPSMTDPCLVSTPSSSPGSNSSSSSSNSSSASSSSGREPSSPEDAERTIIEACHDGDIIAVRRMLDDGGNANQITDDGESLLSLSCAAGYYDLALILLNAGANVDDRNENGHTPLMEAASGGHVDVAKLLLIRGADVNVFSSEFKESALTLASYKGHLDVVQLLLQNGADFEHKTDEMHTALMEASMDGHVDVALALIKAGAQINIPADSFESPLTLAACGGHKRLVMTLLEQGANYKEVNDEGYTPLMEAAREGHLEVVALLLNHGSPEDINQTTDDTQETALTLASCGGFPNVVKYLLERGADVNLGGTTPLMEAAQEGHKHVLEILVEAGADINKPADNSGETAVMYACENGHVEIVRKLISLNAQLEVHDEMGKTALIKAIRGNHYKIVYMLIHFGCSPNNGSPDNSFTPLSTAIERGLLKIVRMLLLNRADPQHYLKDNTSMLLEAAKHGYTEIMRTLVEFTRNTNGSENPFYRSIIDNHIIDATTDLAGLKNPVITSPGHIQWQLPEAIEGNPETTDLQHQKEIAMTKNTPKKNNNEIPTLFKPMETPSDELNFDLFWRDDNQKGVAENLPHVYEQDFEVNLYKDEGLPASPHQIAIDEFEQHVNAYMKSTCPQRGAALNPANYNLSNAPIVNNAAPVINPSTPYPCPNQSISAPHDPAWCIFPASLSRIGEITAKLNEQKMDLASLLPASSDAPPSVSEVPITTASLTQPVVSFSGASPPVANIPVQERRKLVPSKKQLDKKVLHQQKLRQHVMEQLKHCLDETLLQNLEDSLFPSPDSTGSTFPPPMPQPKEINKDCTSMNLDGCDCALRYELLKMENPSLQEINQLFDNRDHLDTTVHLPICPAVSNWPFAPTSLPSSVDPVPPHPQVDSCTSTADLEHVVLNNSEFAALQDNALDYSLGLPKGNSQAWAATKLASRYLPFGTNNPDAVPASRDFAVKSPSTTRAPVKNHKKTLKDTVSEMTGAPYSPELPVMDWATKGADVSKGPETISSCEEESTPPNTVDVPAAVPPPVTVNDPSVQSICTIDVNAVSDSNQDSPLNLAAAGGHEEMVNILLQFGADADHADKKGFTSLCLAAAAGHYNVCEILLRYGANIEAYPEKSKDTPLCSACSGGRLDLAELFIDQGANKEHRNINDYTPLSLAASAGHVTLVEMLLRKGAEINSRTGSKLGISPLMLAAMNGHSQVVKLLLEKGSDINAQIETNKNTALTLACFRGRDQVVRLLLERKALIEHRAKTGLTPLMEAASGGFVEVGRILLEKGADLNAAPVPSSKDTALTIAADKGHQKFVQLLIENGACVEVKNKKGDSPLWLAANGGYLEVVNALLKHGAHPDSTDNRGVSVLVAAFRRGHIKVVKVLIKHVSQFPSESELERYMNTITDPKLAETVYECATAIRAAKDKYSVEANKAATDLLLQVEAERRLGREETRKQSAKKNRERKKNNNKKDTKAKQPTNSKQQQQQQQKKQTESAKSSKKTKTKASANQKTEEIEPKAEAAERVPEEKDGDSGIDSNSQTSASSEVKAASIDQSAKTKRRKKKKEPPPKDTKNKVKTVITVEEPPAALRPVKSHQQASTSSCPAVDTTTASATTPVVKPKKPLLSETSPESLTVYKDLKPLVNRSRQLASGSSRINALDTFGEPSPEPVRTSSTTALSSRSYSIRDKKLRKVSDDWQEVSRKGKKISVPSNAISRVIGRAGCNINRIREVSGANIEVEKQGKSQGDRLITIKGPAEATRQAQMLITSLVDEPDKDLSEIIPRTSAKVSTKVKSFPIEIRSSRQPTPGVTPQPLSARPVVSTAAWAAVASPKRSTAKIPPLMPKTTSTRDMARVTSRGFDEAPTFASKVAETKVKSTSNINSLDAIDLESSPSGQALQTQQYSIFSNNNPLSQVTQDVTSKEPKSFARAASGGLQRPKTPLGHQMVTAPQTIYENSSETQLVDASRAPGYRGVNTSKPSYSGGLSSIEAPAADSAHLPTTDDSSSRPTNILVTSSGVNGSMQMDSASSLTSTTVVTSLARSAPGTPIASPSTRSVPPQQLRQTVTPPPMLNRTTYQDHFSQSATKGPSPIPSLLGISTSPPDHSTSQSQVSPSVSLVSSYSSFTITSTPPLTNLAVGGPVSSQRSHTDKVPQNPLQMNQFYRKPHPIQPMDHTMQLAQQMQANSNNTHAQMQQMNASTGQFPQQLLQPSAMLQQHNFPQGLTSIDQLMSGMQLNSVTQNGPIYSAGNMAPISAPANIQSSLNPNAPQFSSRADSLHLQQQSFAGTRGPITQFTSGYNQSLFPNNTMPQYAPLNGNMESAQPKLDFVPNMFTRSNSSLASMGYRAPVMNNNDVPTHQDMLRNYLNVIDDKSGGMKPIMPIGTERAQRMSKETVGRPVVATELINSYMPPAVESPTQGPIHHQATPAFYATEMEMAQYNNSPQQWWSDKNNP